MEINKIISLENNGLNMEILKNDIYVRNGKNMLKYDLISFNKTMEKQILNKDGMARSFFINGNKLYLRDFCDLYELNCNSMETLRTWKLGENLSSDICSENGDKNNIYACIRGGNIIKIDIKTGKYKNYLISNSSMWDIIVNKNFIYVVNTEGQLIQIDGNNMSIIQTKNVHRKNIYSIIIHKNVLYTVSQDKALIATDSRNLDTLCIAKNVMNNMSIIIGIFNNKLVTSNPNRNEITIWNINDLSVNKIIEFPTYRNGVIIHKNAIYGSNKNGIYKLDIENI